MTTTALYSAFSGLTAGLLNGVKIPKINSGRGSLSAIQKQIYTKLIKGQISKVSMKTVGKMMMLNTINSILPSIMNSILNGNILIPYKIV